MGCQRALTPQRCPSASFSLTSILQHRGSSMAGNSTSSFHWGWDTDGATLGFILSRMEMHRQMDKDSEVALAQRGQRAHLCMCGIRSRCRATLPERAARHLSTGDGDRQRDKTDALGMRTASDEWPSNDTDYTGHQAQTQHPHPPGATEPTVPFGMGLFLLLLTYPHPSLPWSCSCLAGPEAEELKPPGAGHLSQHHPWWMWLLSYWGPSATSPRLESC